MGNSRGARKQRGNELESSLITALKESNEEMGDLPEGMIRKIPYTHKKIGTDFTYDTFILEVNKSQRKSFIPRLNWENTDYRWIKLDELYKIDLHPGVKELLDSYPLKTDQKKKKFQEGLEGKLSLGLIISLSTFTLTTENTITGNAIAGEIIPLSKPLSFITLGIALICAGLLVYRRLYKD